MNIRIFSVVEYDQGYSARATAVAQDASIYLEVRFAASQERSQLDLWDRAYDEVLRYLDPL